MNGNDFYCGNSSNGLCQLALASQIPAAYVHPANKQCNYSYTHPTEKQCSWTPDTSGFGKTVELFNQSFTNYFPYSNSPQPIATMTLGKRYPILYIYFYFISSGSTTETDNRFYLEAMIKDSQDTSRISFINTLNGSVGDILDMSNSFEYISRATKSGSSLPKKIRNFYGNGFVSFDVLSNQIELYLYTGWSSCQNLKLSGNIRVVGLDL